MEVRTMILCFLAFITLLVSGYEAADEDCMFTNSMFTPKRNKIGEMTEEECKDACGQQLNCIYWQMLGEDCWLHFADVKSKKDSDFGINNCKDGKPAGNAPQCDDSDGIGKLKQEVLKLPSSKDCMQNCDDDCIIWEYNRKSEVCKISKLEVDLESKGSVGIHYCNQGPFECYNYKVLNAPSRNIKIGAGKNTDWIKNRCNAPTEDWQGLNWYRFEGAAGTKLATKPPTSEYHCGTIFGGWTDSTLPSKVWSSKDIKVCFVGKGYCYFSIAAKATNCGSYMVYNFDNTPNCYSRYCGTN